MPARLDVDREAVKTLAVAVGVREAARQMGLPESTVKSWSDRGDWFKTPVQPPTVLRASNASKPSDCLATAIADNCTRARVALSKTALKAGEAFERLQGRSVIGKDKSVAFRNITAATAQIGGWDQDKGDRGLNLAVNIGIIGS